MWFVAAEQGVCCGGLTLLDFKLQVRFVCERKFCALISTNHEPELWISIVLLHEWDMNMLLQGLVFAEMHDLSCW